MTAGGGAEDLLRALAPQVLGVLARRYGHFDVCEDAVQDALAAAARQWPVDGQPDHPKGWLVTVASRRLTDRLRGDEARRRREERHARLTPAHAWFSASPDAPSESDRDDTLPVLLMCAHPALTPASQLALTLRAVGGLTTAEIAAAFLVPETTMAQRISRAKATIARHGSRFTLPPADELPERIAVVRHAIYLVFNEGYTATSGPALGRADLAQEAIRLARLLHHLVPHDGETTGLLALLLLADARRAARTTPDGALVPLAMQDRSRWDQAMIAEGVALLTSVLGTAPLGPYQVQAAIAAVHDEATDDASTDWPQVVALYEVLERLAPNPVVTLNRAVAVGQVRGPRAGLDVLDTVAHDERLAGSHRLEVVRAHLLEADGDVDGAAAAYARAAAATTNAAERRHLSAKAAVLAPRPRPASTA